jgi:flagellar basal body P-ring formation protein FlgA
MTRALTILIAAAALPAPALAATAADLSAIDRQVAVFTGASRGTPGGAVVPVDRRLRLNTCNSPLDLSWHTARKYSVVFQCPDPGSWRLFVPVNAAHGAAAAPETPAITRGEAVTVSVTGDGFAVSQPGVSMDSGPVGAWIRVRMAEGGIARGGGMRAQVVRPGLVMIPMP